MFIKLYCILLLYSDFCDARLIDQSKQDDEGKIIDLLSSINFNNMENIKSESRRSYGNDGDDYDDSSQWKGRWFPGDSKMTMGVHKNCDDGKTNLQIDWDNSPENYTCFERAIEPNDSEEKIYCEYIPKLYYDAHLCMNETIEYDDLIPVYGNHRPVWPVYGEYKFIPRERWLHSIEHGAVVMLYHPCAHPKLIDQLKSLVKNCLRRYIITPYNLVDVDRPFVLVTRGCRMEMTQIVPEIVEAFIRVTGLHGPEDIPEDGGFDEGLIEKAPPRFDESVSTLCSKS